MNNFFRNLLFVLPFAINICQGQWNPEECLFIKKGIISNEVLHTFPLKKQWEFKVLIEMADTIKRSHFDRKRLMAFITPLFHEDNPDTNYRKETR